MADMLKKRWNWLFKWPAVSGKKTDKKIEGKNFHLFRRAKFIVHQLNRSQGEHTLRLPDFSYWHAAIIMITKTNKNTHTSCQGNRWPQDSPLPSAWFHLTSPFFVNQNADLYGSWSNADGRRWRGIDEKKEGRMVNVFTWAFTSTVPTIEKRKSDNNRCAPPVNDE